MRDPFSRLTQMKWLSKDQLGLAKEITKLGMYISINGHATVHSFSTFSTTAMEAEPSTHAVQDAVQVQNGCQCGGTGHGFFLFKAISREHGRDALGWARKWERFAVKHFLLQTKTMYFLLCQVLGLPPRPQPRMPPVSGPALQEIINQLTASVDDLKEKARIEKESCRLVLPPSTFSALERTITCECLTKNLVRGEFYVQDIMRLYRRKQQQQQQQQ